MSDYTDLIARLREVPALTLDMPVEVQMPIDSAAVEAADEINALATDNAALRANRDYWMEAAQQAQDHRDGANLQLALVEADNAALREQLTKEQSHSKAVERRLEDYIGYTREAQARLAEAEAKIDALMLEYCSDEMTDEQREQWASHQRPADRESDDAR